MMESIEEIRGVLRQFQDAYTAREVSKLDEVMALFAPGDEAEMIGIGVTERFQGREQIREMIESDWKYWGDVEFDVEQARIKQHSDVAWLTTSGALIQVEDYDKATPFYLEQMKELLEDERVAPHTRMMEAAHYGVRRWRERTLGAGQRWPFMFSAILVRHTEGWRFHHIQWAMPVD
jgi:hypothetical protein